MTRFALIVLALLLLGQRCDEAPTPPKGKTAWCHGLDDPSAVIAGGIPSTDRRSTVLMVNLGKGYYTGVVIGPRKVLTSAHAMPSPGSPMQVVVRDNEGVKSRHEVAKFVVHPDYDPNVGKWYEADLAVVFTTTALPPPYASLYHPAMAPRCTTMRGQGFAPNPGEPTYQLNEATFWVVRQDTANGRPYLLISEQYTKPGGTRVGDSGGALWAEVGGRWYVAGILSMGWPEKARSGHIWPWYYKDFIEGATL